MRFLIKVAVTSLIIAGASELGKRSVAAAAILASLPLTSLLTILWIYRDSGDAQKVISLSYGIAWAVIPSILFLLTLPLFLRSGIKFGPAIVSAGAVTFAGYSIYVFVLSRIGVKF